MSLFTVSGVGVSDDEIMLGKPDDAEARDLGLHVRKCALRYSIFVRRQKAQGDDITQIKYCMWALIALVAVTSPQSKDVLAWILQHLFT